MACFRVHVVTLVSGGELDRQVGLVESAADDFEFSPVGIQLAFINTLGRNQQKGKPTATISSTAFAEISDEDIDALFG